MESSLFTKEKVYEIAYSIENGYERKELTDEEGKTILNSMNDLQIFSNICIYANCIKSSIKELKAFLLSLKFNQHSYIDFANAQRLTLNMLSHVSLMVNTTQLFRAKSITLVICSQM